MKFWRRKPKIDYGERLFHFAGYSEKFILSVNRAMEEYLRKRNIL